MRTVGIVGGGFSGTVLAARLLRDSLQPIRVLLFDRTGTFGAGVAYSSNNPRHLLNVPAGKMSAFPECPSSFVDWLACRNISPEDGFAERRHFRQYLSDLLDKPAANSASELHKVGATVTAIEGHFNVQTATGETYHSEVVVLATGYLKGSATCTSGAKSPFEEHNWPESGVRNVVIVGSGLTAVDAATSVFGRYPKANVTCVSRHGLLPRMYDLAPGSHAISGSPPTDSLRELFKWIRAEIQRAESSGASWTPVFDAMRPKWESIWQSLTDADRRRFLSHLLRHFDSCRHRMAPSQHAFLIEKRLVGAFNVQTGRLTSIEGKTVTVRTQAGLKCKIPSDLVLDCSGFSSQWTKSSDPLVQYLLANKLVQSGPLGMGIRADELGQISDALFTMGPPLRGQLFETTAAPELSRQAAVLSDRILRFFM